LWCAVAVIDIVDPDVVHRISIELLVAKCRPFIANRQLRPMQSCLRQRSL
jgi:hypothetical protein